MKGSLKILKILAVIAVLGFLFSFSNERNRARTVNEIDVQFLDEHEPFLSRNTVNKLLIQKESQATGVGKETLVLKEMEQRLIENPMVRDAEVYVTIDGVLGAKITQRKPVGRVVAGLDYYVDEEGKRMPLSTEYAARVPLITGNSQTNFSELSPLLNEISEDDFMKSMVIGLHRLPSGEVELQLRNWDFQVHFGRPTAIEKKFQNFKAFYKKTKQDSTLYGYELVNLKFESQVVATKKEGYGK